MEATRVVWSYRGKKRVETIYLEFRESFEIHGEVSVLHGLRSIDGRCRG